MQTCIEILKTFKCIVVPNDIFKIIVDQPLILMALLIVCSLHNKKHNKEWHTYTQLLIFSFAVIGSIEKGHE